MTVRLAAAEDADILARLHGRVFPHGPWDARFWRDAVKAPIDQPLIAGDPPSGFALLRLLGEEAEILTIGTVRPRQGEGRALLSALMALATSAGARRLFLEVSAANKAALALYRRAGFAETGLRPSYYADGSDALTMRCELC